MYPRKVSLSLLPAKHNLNNVVLDTKKSYLLKYTLTFRQLAEKYKNVDVLKSNVTDIFKNGDILNVIKKNIQSLPNNLKTQSASILKLWTRQCECVLAYRLRRGQQMFCLYSKLWEERALRDFFTKLRRQLFKRTKGPVFTTMGLSLYNWEANRITDEELTKHTKEIEYLHMLKKKTITCSVCKDDTKCSCANQKIAYIPYDDWNVFIEKTDLIVWRRLHKSGSYEYKVYGSYGDVCAEDFLNVQIDINYRRTWDASAVALELIEKHPNPKMNSDVIYWEMMWPRFFTNRDYIFKRRFLIDHHKKLLYLVNKCTEHPSHPVVHNKYRVTEYWSYMVIKPSRDFQKPGLEFGLTYYDNPGINMPDAVTAWVAYRAMPDFLARLRVAAKGYSQYCVTRGCEKQAKFDPGDSGGPVSNERARDNAEFDEFLRYGSFIGLKLKMLDDVKEPKTKEMSLEKSVLEITAGTSAVAQHDAAKQQTYWKYLQPTYYFG